ncbi:VCBS repeat-containing protein [Robertkochia aurantiaca]|uniref:VCBS repeat-containing protein n=1 Tax=Robertkochia aurantiaca TaxID=2873700 RepID=UPI001CCCDCE7|nr:VCBS repeat-containing protein [Robertkochia sp. 3YJGBD-33]
MAILLISCNNKEAATVNKPEYDPVITDEKIYDRLTPEETGIDFSNEITANLSTLENLFNYDYFYNGAGVGMADINNDGLPDLFFAGNQVKNRLYLNKGNMVFEDITEKAGINTGKIWSNGVTFADINQDGYIDIYVTQGGPHKRLQRKNLLFINNKDNTFTEMAESYGLADMGISTQAVFFDHDKDGDLDCFILNENELYGLDPLGLYSVLKEQPEALQFNTCRFYVNNNGKFVDSTEEAGLLRPFFGLGLTVSDINNDSWPDIYAASDYYLPDALYINNQKGGFTDEIKNYTNQISFYGMGIDIADINNDAREDIYVLDMAANDHVRSKTLMASMSTDRFDFLVNTADFQYQYMYNSLQLNQGNNRFDNIAQVTKTASTDWSWSVLMSDLDNNTLKDIFVTNGYRRYALDNDTQRRVFETQKKYNGNVPLEVKQQLYESIPSEKLPNLIFRNEKDLHFENVNEVWGLEEATFSNGAVVGDLDNDGDLDIVINNMDEEAFVYRNNTSEKKRANFIRVKPEGKISESFPKVSLYAGGQHQYNEVKRVRGYRSAQEPVAHFGLGNISQIDSIVVEWPSGMKNLISEPQINTVVNVSEKDATKPAAPELTEEAYFENIPATSLGLVYTHKENDYDDFEQEILLPYKQSNIGPVISRHDVDGDGDEDLFIGGASGQAASLFIREDDTYIKTDQPAFDDDRNYEDMEAAFFDLEGDGDLDIYIVSGGNEFEENSEWYADRIYLNDGNQKYTRWVSQELNERRHSGKAVLATDIDNDGDSDLIVGNRIRPRHYPQPSPAIVYQNNNGVLEEVTESIAPELLNFGIINDLQLTDFNNDGTTDFIAVGEWTEIGFFENRGGTFKKVQKEGIPKERGWWYSVQETDVNNDGMPDYLVGNVGMNIKFKASEEKPFKVFATDFDDNGSNDIVLSKKYKDEYVPVRGRECSSQQMPFIKEKFETYNEFANAKLIDIYGDKLESSYKAEVTEFHSVLLLNNGDGTFKKVELPVEAQLIPIMAAVFTDLNGDGFEDAILGGNIYETEVETPRLDALSGIVLLSNGKDGYQAISHAESGLYLNGNIKSMTLFSVNNDDYLLAAQNNGPIFAHKIKKP